MSTKNPPSANARRVLAALAAAAVFTPGMTFASPASDARAAMQRVITIQGTPAPTADGSATTVVAGSQAGLLAAQARDQLARNLQIRQSLLSLQNAARAAAQAAASSVPNGLVTGGLQVANGASAGSLLWSGAALPVQQVAGGLTQVTIAQTSPQAMLTWDAFNIGRETALKFDQSLGGANQGQWIAFNKIVDPSGNPTRILGSIEAPGQVYVINPNGVIFSGTAQVNTRTLVASSLPLNESLVARGVLNNPDTQFLFTGLAVAGGAQTNAFTPPAPLAAGGHYGDVLVEAGALLNSPSNADKSGGRVALIGPNVTNAGTISTPDGQTLLAAGLQVGLEASSDATLRGLNIHVGNVGDYAGTATNSGLIDSARGAVTVVGKTVNQNGLVGATTSVSRNGRIDLLAQYDSVGVGDYANLPDFFPVTTGLVTLGGNSATEILPELSSTEKTVGTKLALNSQLNVRGLVIHVGSNASILAPSASVNFDAGRWNLLQLGTGQANAQFVYPAGQIYFDTGASLSVAGTPGVTASVADNIIEVSLRGDELANSPLQRDGSLRGLTIKVDVLQTGVYNGLAWVGTPLADASGYVNLIQRDVGQLTTGGGTVKLSAGGSVVLRSGASIDVSGGYVDYQGANIETTKVISGGVLYDISKATPDLVYQGIYTGVFTPASNTAKWGAAAAQARQSVNRLFTEHAEPGFIQGGAAGTLAITAPSMALDAAMTGHAVSGIRQRATPATSGALSLGFQGQYASADAPTGYFSDARTPPSVRITSGPALNAPADFSLDGAGLPNALNAERTASVVLSPSLATRSGFGLISVDNREGDISVAADGALSLPALGQLTLAGKNVDVAANLSAPGGKIVLSATAVSQDSINQSILTGAAPSPEAARGRLQVAAGVRISTAGLVESDAIGSPSDPLVTTGGTISLTGYDVALATGSLLDVSGGVYASNTAKLAYGNAGSLSVLSGQDANMPSAFGGHLNLGATPLGYSGAKGGALILKAPAIQVGDGLPAANATVLSTEFFRQGGFASYAVSGLGGVLDPELDLFSPGVRITAGTTIKPVAYSYVAVPDNSAPEKLVLQPTLLDVSLRSPASVSFSAVGVRDPFNGANPLLIRGDLIMEAGARIETDSGAKISLSGETANVQGTLIAHGGSITLKGSSNSNPLFPSTIAGTPVSTLTLGAGSALDASGTSVLRLDATGLGLRTGKVLPGGAVTLTGNVRAAAGSSINVSGATDTFDLDPVYSGRSGGLAGNNQIATRVDSSGGTVTLTGGQQLITAATLHGASGGPSAEGGKLLVSSGIYQPIGAASATQQEINLIVTQGVATSPDSGRGNFAADSFNTGGFDSLTLAGTVGFSGPVSLVAPRELNVATGGVLYGDAAVSLSGARVSIGMALQKPLLSDADKSRAFYDANSQPLAIAPVHGDALLAVSATQLIDVGNLTLQGFGAADLQTPAGDIRGSGTLDIAGALSLRAAQLYPPTATTFSLNAYDYQAGGLTHAGSIVVLASTVTPALPFSAGGTLNLNASSIRQNGILRAPFGTINLGWGGTGSAPVDSITGLGVPVAKQVTLGSAGTTSVSGLDPLTGRALTLPYGAYINGSAWVDPQGRDITNLGPVAKQVNLSGQTVTTEVGASVDINGGGDLLASRFKTGPGGKVDILGSLASFAIVPGYGADYAPFAPFNDTVYGKALLGNDTGYVNTSLALGDRIHLDASPGLPAGDYTLMAARYAVLPGAFLITPKSGAPLAEAAVQPDKAAYVSGLRFNSTSPAAAPLRSLFEVASAEVVKARATYETPSAATFFSASAATRDATPPRLPTDAGQLAFIASLSMNLQGGISARAATGGLGGLVDISSPIDIRIAGPGASATSGQMLLDASRLSAFSGASLLIGGSRQTGVGGTVVAVSSDNITVDNAGSPLIGAEIILTAKKNLTVADGGDIRQSGALGGKAESLKIGDAALVGSGDGALLRVTSDADAALQRSGVSAASTAVLTLGVGAKVSGGAGLILDSTGTTQVATTATFGAEALTLNSGRISLQLDNPGELQAGPGLVLTGSVLDAFQASSKRLSLLSYSTIDIYGAGVVGSANFEKLTLGSPAIRGFNNSGGTATFNAATIALGGGVGGTAPAALAAPSGTLAFAAQTLRIDAGQLSVGQFDQLLLRASDSLLFSATGGLSASANMSVETPLVTAATAAVQALSAGGSLRIATLAGGAASAATTTGLGARLTLTGGAGVGLDTAVRLAGGRLAVHATGGDVSIGGQASARLDVGGTAIALQDVVKYTNAGGIELKADAGNVLLGRQGSLVVAAQSLAGDAGTLTVSAANGFFTSDGALLGEAGQGGAGGGFALDAGSLPGGDLAPLDAALNAGGFTTARSHRVRSGDVLVSGLATARTYEVSADNGALTVTGTLDASGVTGGSINLSANGNLTVASGALLDASGDTFNNAGKGGSIKLGAGASRNGVANPAASLTLASGATLDLSVLAANPLADAVGGRATGTVQLRAPRDAAGTDLAVNSLASAIVGASSVVLEGFKVRDLTPGSGTDAAISSAIRTAVLADATTFGNATASILARATGTDDAATLHVQPGIELVNLTGDLSLAGIWDLSTARYGPAATLAQREPGVLTLRAAGNINFPYAAAGSASLSDGFGTGVGALTTTTNLWNAALLPEGSRSWSYNLVAGADLSSARTLAVQAANTSAPSTGTLLIGAGAPAFDLTDDTRQATNGVPRFYQVIRTGTGDIAIAARGDIELRNNLATIYTVGTRAAAMDNFDLPNTAYRATALGSVQYSPTAYAAQYSLGGGDVTLFAQNNLFRTLGGQADSSRQMPENWLYRRGNVDAATGDFAALANSATSRPGTTGERTSTSWWVDFNNFFEGVGALGGGNVSLLAGANGAHIDAVAPPHARMPYGHPDASKLLELGGGDVTVRAGAGIDAGVYYVERGLGKLTAGGDITTNSTRTTLRSADYSSASQTPSSTWLPTTLFLGKGTFTVRAGGDLTLGSVANPFLLPGGVNNSYFLKTYFSTYAPDSGVDALSLTGDVTLRERNANADDGSLFAWFNNVLRRDPASPTSTLAGKNQPWLRLYENDLAAFGTVASLLPGTLRAVAASGDVNLVGDFNLTPSAQGALELVAADSINGLQMVQYNTSTNLDQWASATLNFSDAAPARLPTITAPRAISITVPTGASAGYVASQLVSRASANNLLLLDPVTALFTESGAYTGDVYGRLQTKQNLHAATSVRAAATEPVRLVAGSGDISGLTLYSSQVTDLRAGRDISDVGLYLQNLSAADVSVVSAGRDILLYNPDSALRTQAVGATSTLLGTSSRAPGPGNGNPTSGDLQIGGAGTLSVLAGRNLDLGNTLPPDDGISGGLKSPGDGTAVGLTSIGNARNLSLPDTGARIVIGVGVGDASKIDAPAFATAFLNPATAGANSARYLPALAALLGLSGSGDAAVWSAYAALPADARTRFALSLFNQVLRDAGRDHNNAASAGFGTYAAGFSAIEKLFPGSTWQGDLRLSSRELITSANSDVLIFAPGGGVNLGSELSTSETPPGIITERGGDIAIFTRDNVDIGSQRIFTLRGGDILIWSSTGNIAAGSSSTTLQSASPTRVVVDPQSGDVQTDLAGLATGGGIGVLAAVKDVPPGNVDLIAPVGTIDAGDAGIRSAGNISIAALTVLNAANISAGGATTGAPAAPAPAMSVATTAASPKTGADSAAENIAAQAGKAATDANKMPSLVTIEVFGYGGGDTTKEKDKDAPADGA